MTGLEWDTLADAEYSDGYTGHFLLAVALESLASVVGECACQRRCYHRAAADMLQAVRAAGRRDVCAVCGSEL